MNKLFLLGIPVLLTACVEGSPTQPTVPAEQPSFAVLTDLSARNWRVYNVKPATSAYWDINKAADLPGGLVQFPFQPFLSTTTGSFAVYLLVNYNYDLTAKTMTANVAWDAGSFVTRRFGDPNCSNAYVRLEFQDVASGNYDSNDYWWSTVGLDLNAVTSGVLVGSLADRNLWINQSGKPATDLTQNWVEWQGDTVHVSPYDGFTKAMKNVKQVSLSFGNECAYASGAAILGGSASFRLNSFTIQ
jgi:hypothetical protein